MPSDTLDNRLFEAKTVFLSVRLFKLILDFIVSFLFVSIIFALLRIWWFYAFFFSFFIFLAGGIYEYLRADMRKKLTGKYDHLDERLQTALEYKKSNNIIVSDLVNDVSKRVDLIETSVFFNKREISYRVFATVILAFIFLTVTVYDLADIARISLDDLLRDPTFRRGLNDLTGEGKGGMDTFFENQWEQSNWTTEADKDKLGADSGGETPGISEGPIEGVGGGTGFSGSQDLYGDASSASILGTDVDFRVNPEFGGDIEIRETGGRQRTRAFTLNEVSSVEECTDCMVGPENEEMVRRYFEKILPDS